MITSRVTLAVLWSAKCREPGHWLESHPGVIRHVRPQALLCILESRVTETGLRTILEYSCHICYFESKDIPTQMTKQSFTIIYFITFKKTIHFHIICKNVHS